MSVREWRSTSACRQSADQSASQLFVRNQQLARQIEQHYQEDSGQDGVCTTQPSANREIVPVQQPARVVRKAHVFDEVADAWREILEVSMPVSEHDTPHIPPPDFVPKKEMSCKACDIKFLNFNTWKQHQIVVHHMSIKD